MDIPWFLQDYQMREGKGFNLPNYSVSPGNIVNPCRHDSKTNKKQMPGNQVLSAVLIPQPFGEMLWEEEGERGSRRTGKREID